jgi:hypothetical protein
MKLNQKRDRDTKEFRIPMIILVFGVFLTFFAPYILTMPSIRQCWNFTETGNIGDTIGGITSPIVGLIGAVLMFYSIYLQYKANVRQDKAMKDQFNMSIIQDLFLPIINYFPNENTPYSEERSKLESLAKLADDKISNLVVNEYADIFFHQINFLSTQFELLFNFLNSDLENSDFPQLELQKGKAVILLNQFISTSKCRIVVGHGIFQEDQGEFDYPLKHLSKINVIIKSWGEIYSKISTLDVYIGEVTKDYLDSSDIEDVI